MHEYTGLRNLLSPWKKAWIKRQKIINTHKTSPHCRVLLDPLKDSLVETTLYLLIQ